MTQLDDTTICTVRNEEASSTRHELSVLASVAHELRGPLTALTAAADLLAEDFERLSPSQVGDMLAAMHRRTVWLQGLVENLLCAASIREGRLQLHREPLSLGDILVDVHSVVEPILAQRGQRLRVHMAPGLPQVSADKRRVGQVLVNLILNASKFGPHQTQIEVSISSGTDGGLRLAVADRGPGVAAQFAEQVFEPYYQAPATTNSSKEGIGLGLSIVKSVVEAHGGLVGVENRRGGGACFWFSLPTGVGQS
jgi:signal transduction histidine kinase